MTSGEMPGIPATFYARRLKPILDTSIAILAVIVTLPLMIVVAIAVRLMLGAPVLFHDERAGLGGRPIRVTKFRSMSSARDAAGNLLPDHARLSAFGRLLRRTSLDELPQLWSVISGDMSVVGPRPLPMRYVARFNARQRARLVVLPGITGWAQIHGRNEITWTKRLEYDVEYVEKLGRPFAAFTDCWIILVTVYQVIGQFVTGRGLSAPGQVTMSEFTP